MSASRKSPSPARGRPVATPVATDRFVSYLLVGIAVLGLTIVAVAALMLDPSALNSY